MLTPKLKELQATIKKISSRRIKYIINCPKKEKEIRCLIALTKNQIKFLKLRLNINYPDFAIRQRVESRCVGELRTKKLELTALKKLLPDIKVRRSDGVLIVEGVIWKNFFKKYFAKCKDEDEILEMNMEICNAVKAAAKARMDKLYKKSL